MSGWYAKKTPNFLFCLFWHVQRSEQVSTYSYDTLRLENKIPKFFVKFRAFLWILRSCEVAGIILAGVDGGYFSGGDMSPWISLWPEITTSHGRKIQKSARIFLKTLESRFFSVKCHRNLQRPISSCLDAETKIGGFFCIPPAQIGVFFCIPLLIYSTI